MRRRISTLLLALLLPSSFRAQDDDRSVQSKVIATERALRVLACQLKDIKIMNAILDDSFTGINEQGALQTKAELLRFVQTAAALHGTADSMIVKLHGETAIVTGLYEIKGVSQGKVFQHRGRFVDTWLQKYGQWVVVGSVSTLEP